MISGRKIFTVTQVNLIAKEMLENVAIWVEGEVSQIESKDRQYRYVYFSLKDPKTEYKLPCIAEPSYVTNLDFDLREGNKYLMYGNLSLYEVAGKYQFRVAKIQPWGEGELQKRLEELKSKLQKEGLFDESKKKPLPKYPLRVGVITSAQGAAWEDFRSNCPEKYPLIKVILKDVFVQGDKAAQDIQNAIEYLDKKNLDVIVITRGGGALEDLMAFNSENVARAIYNAKTPIISAVGHEKDVSIADLVADVRASTPTKAANIIVENFDILDEELEHKRNDLERCAKEISLKNFQRLDEIYYKLTQTRSKYKDLPARLNAIEKDLQMVHLNLIDNNNERLKNIQKAIISGIKNIYQENNQRLEQLISKIEILSPQNTLNRGYSMVMDSSGKIVKDSQKLDIGDELAIQLARGRVLSKVTEKYE